MTFGFHIIAVNGEIDDSFTATNKNCELTEILANDFGKSAQSCYRRFNYHNRCCREGRSLLRLDWTIDYSDSTVRLCLDDFLS